MEELEKVSQFLFYSTEEGTTSVQVIIDSNSETIWTTQKGMSKIFGVDRTSISKHLKNIFESGELVESVVCANSSHTTPHGAMEEKTQYTDVKLYNLDAIISVGYRINSTQATRFRIWATQILKEYLIKGFSLDDERLKQGNKLFGKDYFNELIERIREIRASERMLHEKITDLYRDCSADYDKNAKITTDFYASVQNRLHFAIHQHTAAELIKERADSTKPYMGLLSYKASKTGGKVLLSDTSVAKNYMTEKELKGLHRLVTMFLDYAEHFAEKKIIMNMSDWIGKLSKFLSFNEYPALNNKGNISSKLAKEFAKDEFAKFRIIQDKDYKSDFNNFAKDVQFKSLKKETETSYIEASKPQLSDFDKKMIIAGQKKPSK